MQRFVRLSVSHIKIKRSVRLRATLNQVSSMHLLTAALDERAWKYTTCRSDNCATCFVLSSLNTHGCVCLNNVFAEGDTLEPSDSITPGL